MRMAMRQGLGVYRMYRAKCRSPASRPTNETTRSPQGGSARIDMNDDK